jgi:hypothetical protein
MNEEYVTIPRNIKVKEIISYGLSGKQLVYLAFGIGKGVLIWMTALPVDVKIAGSVIAITISLALSLAKAHGQDLDKYILNSIKYPMRQKEFGGESNAKKVSCNIRYNLQ